MNGTPQKHLFEDIIKNKQWRKEHFTRLDYDVVVIYKEIVDEILKLKSPFIFEDILPVLPKFKLKSDRHTAIQYLKWMVRKGILERYKEKSPEGTQLTEMGYYSRWYYHKFSIRKGDIH